MRGLPHVEERIVESGEGGEDAIANAALLGSDALLPTPLNTAVVYAAQEARHSAVRRLPTGANHTLTTRLDERTSSDENAEVRDRLSQLFTARSD